MRNDDALLLDILIASRKVQKFTESLTRDSFSVSDLVQSAVIREIQVIGEAARLISDETKNDNTQIDWSAISGMRNRVVHEYFNIDLDIVWDTIQIDIPLLIQQIEPLVPQDDA